MRIIEAINKIVTDVKGVFDFRIIHRNISHNEPERPFFSFYGSNKGNKWEVELTVPIVDDILADDHQPNPDAFLRKCIYAIMGNFGLRNVKSKRKVAAKDVAYNFDTRGTTTTIFNTCYRQIDTAYTPVYVLSDIAKIGKSQFVRYCCNQWQTPHNKIWWLDFNGGAADISDYLLSLCHNNFSGNNYIILDNIDCCGVSNGNKIIDIFMSLVEIMPQSKLIILQDSNRKIYTPASSQKIEIFDNLLENEIKKMRAQQTITEEIYANIKQEVSDVLNNATLLSDTKKLFIETIFLAKHDVSMHFPNISPSIINELLTIPSIRLMHDNEVIGYPRIMMGFETCSNLLKDFREKIKEVLGEKEYDLLNSNILTFFYDHHRGQKISIVDFHNILRYSGKKNKNIDEFCFLLDQVVKLRDDIAETVLDKGGKPFQNHLGAILFAAEALATYADYDPKALRAWKKLYDHVKDTYLIDTPADKLPEVGRDKGEYDGLLSDFKQGAKKYPRRSCLENQISLHNEMLRQCNDAGVDTLNEEDLMLLQGDNGLDDKLFTLFISKLQKNAKKHIDYDKFFRSYLLALLFEFEVSAPDEQRDEARIEKLWAKIKAHCTEVNGKQPYSYFYPARVPWVTARALLAMCIYCRVPNANPTITHEINTYYKQMLSQYLVNCSLTFKQNGVNYRFWSAGTGLWNTALETTMLCAFSIREAAYRKFECEVKESRNFISMFEDRWFDAGMLADGIWAFQTTVLETLDRENVYKNLADINKRIKPYDLRLAGTTDKNDKSLGTGHVAKTLIDLVGSFLEKRPDVFNYVVDDTEEHERDGKPDDHDPPTNGETLSLLNANVEGKLNNIITDLENDIKEAKELIKEFREHPNSFTCQSHTKKKELADKVQKALQNVLLFTQWRGIVRSNPQAFIDAIDQAFDSLKIAYDDKITEIGNITEQNNASISELTKCANDAWTELQSLITKIDNLLMEKPE